MRATSIRVSTATAEELRLLKIAWKKESLDEVLQVFLREHQLDKLKAIGIQLPEGEQREVHPQEIHLSDRIQ